MSEEVDFEIQSRVHHCALEITEDQIPAARAAGLRIHSFYRHETDDRKTHYCATNGYVNRYHSSGGLWEYNS